MKKVFLVEDCWSFLIRIKTALLKEQRAKKKEGGIVFDAKKQPQISFSKMFGGGCFQYFTDCIKNYLSQFAVQVSPSLM